MAMDAMTDKLSEAFEAVNRRITAIQTNKGDQLRLQGFGIAVGAVLGFAVARKLWASVGQEPAVTEHSKLKAVRGFKEVDGLVSHCGSCACGHVRFTVQAIRKMDVVDCYLHPRKGRFRHIIIAADKFSLQSAPQALAMSSTAKDPARFIFCMDCGVEVCHFPLDSSRLLAVNADCFADVTLERCRVLDIPGRRWRHAFDVVDQSALELPVAMSEGAAGSMTQNQRNSPTAHLTATAAVRRGVPHPLTATGMVYSAPHTRRGGPAHHSQPRARTATVLTPRQRADDVAYVHALLDLPPDVNYQNHAPYSKKRLSDVAASLARNNQSEQAAGTPPRSRATRESPFQGSTPFDPVSSMSPYSIRVPAPSPYTPSSVLVKRENRSRVARSLKNHHTFKAQRAQFRLSASSASRKQNVSPDSVLSQASTQSTVSTSSSHAAALRAAAKTTPEGEVSSTSLSGNRLHQTSQLLRQHLNKHVSL